MYWNWKKGGIALAIVFLAAVVLVKPIGVSTQFVIFDGVIASLVDDSLITEDAESKTGYASSNAYLNKSGGKYAKAVANPMNYGFIFALAMIAGGFIGARTQDEKSEEIPACHKERFGDDPRSRYLTAFIGGFIVLFGARLAGGCTSGHMMSGMMQMAVSGYLFAASAFAAGVPVAILLYKKTGEES